MHLVNADVRLSNRVTVQLHSRLRTSRSAGGISQGRTGPIFQIAAAPRVTLIGGMYVFQGRSQSAGSDYYVRPFAGANIALLATPRLQWNWRNLFERQMGQRRGDYSRLRSRMQVTVPWKRWEFTSGIELVKEPEMPTHRLSAFANRRLTPRLMGGFGYERRQAVNGSFAHIVVTNLTFVVNPKR